MGYHSGKFGGHRHSGNGDMIFVDQVALQYHITRALREFMVRKLLR